MSTLTTTPPRNRGGKLALVVGYLALAGGVLYAYGEPTTGYEVSIYTATPYGFWLGIAIALLVGVIVTLYAPDGYVNLAGSLLAGASVVSIAGLPLIRGYLYYGSADGLTHLGWTKDLFDGSMSVFGDFYPGVHTAGLLVKNVAGTTIPRGLLLAVLTFVVAYLVFIPLCVRSMTSHRGAMVLAGLTGLLLLPINHFGMNYMTPHPISDSILVTPVVIYVLINYVTSPSDVFETRLPISAVGGVFAVVLGSIVLYHPQQAANLIILFLTISGVQLAYRVFRPDSRIAEHKPLYAPTVFLVGSFMLWSVGRGRYENGVNAVLRELFSFLTGATSIAPGTAHQGNALVAAGGSVPELLLKLFGVSMIFAALAGLLMLTSLFGRLRDAPDTAALVKYLTVGLVVLIPYSLVFYIGSISELFFRNVGLIMLVSTILGTIALYRYVTGLSEVLPAGGVRAVTTVVVVVMVVLSVVVIFPSPYIFIPNDQVTRGDLSGYRFAFTHTQPDASIYGLREGPWREDQGLFGVRGNTRASNTHFDDFGTNDTIITSLASRAPKESYLSMTRADREREVRVYNGLRYNYRNFSSLDDQPGVSLVETNGEMKFYLVSGSGRAGINATTPTATRTAGINATTPTNASVFGNASARSSRGSPTARTPAATPTAATTRTAPPAGSATIVGTTDRRSTMTGAGG